MSAEIITPFGGVRPKVACERVEKVAELLHELAERADRGEIIGVAVAYVDGARSVSTTWVSGLASGIEMTHGATKLAHRMLAAQVDAE